MYIRVWGRIRMRNAFQCINGCMYTLIRSFFNHLLPKVTKLRTYKMYVWNHYFIPTAPACIIFFMYFDFLLNVCVYAPKRTKFTCRTNTYINICIYYALRCLWVRGISCLWHQLEPFLRLIYLDVFSVLLSALFYGVGGYCGLIWIITWYDGFLPPVRCISAPGTPLFGPVVCFNFVTPPPPPISMKLRWVSSVN